jgi:hypothetical protein
VSYGKINKYIYLNHLLLSPSSFKLTYSIVFIFRYKYEPSISNFQSSSFTEQNNRNITRGVNGIITSELSAKKIVMNIWTCLVAFPTSFG